MNPLYNILNNVQLPGQLGNFQQFMQQFNQFRSGYSGNPQQDVQNLLSSGRMSQEQFNTYANMATQIQAMMRGR